MKKILAVSALLLSIGSTSAQEIVFPTLEEMAGDYIIINDKDYDGTKFIADMRDMRIIVNSDNSLTFSGYYMRGCLDLEAGYSEDSGNLSYDAGQKIFGIDGEGGVVQYLYGWDDKNQIPTERPITYRYKGNNTWRAESSIVLMSGVEGGELSPYYFSQGSSIYRSNAISHNISYVGLGSEQEMYDETRPSYIQLGTNNSITIYNLLTKDQFGYGCKLEGTYDPETGKVLFKPEVIGQTNDFIYKVLSGCTYDENEMKPTGTSYTDDFTHAGYVDAMIDFQNKRLEIGPMTI